MKVPGANPDLYQVAAPTYFRQPRVLTRTLWKRMAGVAAVRRYPLTVGSPPPPWSPVVLRFPRKYLSNPNPSFTFPL